MIMRQQNMRLKKNYAEKFSKTTSIEIQGQHWDGNRQLSMDGIAVEYFTNSVDTFIKKIQDFIHI